VRGIERIPVGELEGLPAARIALPSGARPEHLVVEFTQVWRVGVRVLWLEAADWSEHVVDEAISQFQSDPRTRDVVLWTQRRVHEQNWPATPLWDVVDVSAFLSAPTRLQDLAEAMMRAPYIPRPTEIVLRDADESNLTPGLLDQILTTYDPERGAWIEFTSPQPRTEERALVAACTAAGGWGVRLRGS